LFRATDATTLPPTPTPAAAPTADWARPLLDRQLAILGRLAEAGLEIAVGLEGQAKGGPEVVAGDVALAYGRVARAVRQTVMLQSQLIQALQDRDKVRAERQAAARSSAARLVRGVIGDERSDDIAHDRERAEQLSREAAERLQGEEFGDLLSRPFGEAVAQIVRDLGLSPDWLALAERCAAAEASLTGRAGEADGQGNEQGSGLLWGERDPETGETRYYDPAERYKNRYCGSRAILAAAARDSS